MGRAVRRPYSDSEESDNDVLYTEEHDSALQRISLRNEWPTQMTVDSRGERCAQLDDFKWFLPTDERAEDLGTPESEIDTSDSEGGVDFIDSFADGVGDSAVVTPPPPPPGGRSDKT